ncbi:TetR/AcrR family transcriptional regulator [Methylobacterium nonmethylotrophicum]|uniref:TetR/AcrR family transcriptional regulator n=1 Tax=Methylobacterium nonmethylotrophicum TaxID=1141884 RepID=A0A4Z0NHT2_9HYPH|nr:TetR/AcrR family transcriptional regulator [Methylobacterium nonmethylotrophicum]TGD95261.1 TetR/AcrR family transcriptional regulator [Methylobacterium nonmethylotrophicum]
MTSAPAEKGGGLAAYRARVVRAKRAAILDAAIATFLENGYDRTSLETIARTGKVSTGTLFKHFPTKAALFGAIMARVWDAEPGAAPPAPAPGAPRAGLTAIGLDYARLLRAPQVEALFRVVIAEAPRFPELGRELYERGKAPYLARVSAYLAAEAAAGTLTMTPKEQAEATRQFLGMINDQIFWPRFLVTDLAIPETEVVQVVQAAVATILARYGTPPGNAP